MDPTLEKYTTLAEALTAASELLHKEARRLSRDAQSLLDRAASHKRWLARIGTAPHLVNQLIAQGSNAPLEEAAAVIGSPVEFVEAHYTEFQRRSAEASRALRDRRICQLARDGLTNAEIVDRIGKEYPAAKVSRSTVQRALRRARYGLYLPPRKGLPKRKLTPPGGL